MLLCVERGNESLPVLLPNMESMIKKHQGHVYHWKPSLNYWMKKVISTFFYCLKYLFNKIFVK